MTLQSVAFVSPNEEGWAVYQLPDSDEVNFGRLWPSQDTDVILVKVTRLLHKFAVLGVKRRES